jgi:colanic acid/amylovoran biosynthesis protein
MRILIYPSAPGSGNLGDLAMLKTALARLKELWPAARLQVLTDDFQSLSVHCPDIEPVTLRGCKRWFRVQALPGWAFPHVPEAVRSHYPLLPDRLWRLGGWLYPPDYRLAREFAEALFSADLLVLAGCGLINDEFSYAATRVLNIFAAAARCGIPTVMFGQGFGPISDGPLLRRAAEVLPQVRRIHLREQRSSLPLLKRLGVTAEKIVVTGDDAIEMSFRERRPAAGTRIGINLRLASYSAINQETVGAVGAVVAEKTRQYQAGAVGIPITIGDAGSDEQTIEQLLGKTAAGGKGADGVATLPDVLRRVGECRVVVAGSYHAGVFALSQGVPVVGIAQSPYYRDKFEGLADQFGAGCTVLRADDGQFAGKLGAAIDRAWNESETIRPQLLRAAGSQVQASRAAYEKLPLLVPPPGGLSGQKPG